MHAHTALTFVEQDELQFLVVHNRVALTLPGFLFLGPALVEVFHGGNRLVHTGLQGRQRFVAADQADFGFMDTPAFRVDGGQQGLFWKTG